MKLYYVKDPVRTLRERWLASTRSVAEPAYHRLSPSQSPGTALKGPQGTPSLGPSPPSQSQ